MISCRSLIRKHIGLLNPGELFTTRDLLSYGSRSAVDRCTYLMVKWGIFTRLAFGVFVVTEGRRSTYSIDEIAECKARAFGRSPHAHGSNFIVGGSISDAISFSIEGIKTENDVMRRELKSPVTPEQCLTDGEALLWEPLPEISENFALMEAAVQSESVSCRRSRLAFPAAEYIYCGKASSSKFVCKPDLSIDENIQIRLKKCCSKLLHFRDTKVGKAIRSLVCLGKGAVEDGAAVPVLMQLNHTERMEIRMASAWMPSWLSDSLMDGRSCIDSANRFWKLRMALREQKL